VEINKPTETPIPLSMTVSSYSAFRGLLFKAYLHFEGHAGAFLRKRGSARLVLGDHPIVAPLKQLEIDPEPLMTAFIPAAHGVLDDHLECWFLSYDKPPAAAPAGMESVVNLGLSQKWLSPPKVKVNF